MWRAHLHHTSSYSSQLQSTDITQSLALHSLALYSLTVQLTDMIHLRRIALGGDGPLSCGTLQLRQQIVERIFMSTPFLERVSLGIEEWSRSGRIGLREIRDGWKDEVWWDDTGS